MPFFHAFIHHYFSINRIVVRFIIVVIFICIGLNVYAGCSINDFQVDHYTTENGLPQNSIKNIAIDEIGFFWFSTEMGLVRFDGNRFKLFNKTNTSISSNRILSLMRGQANQLIGVNDKWEALEIRSGRVNQVIHSPDSVLGSAYKDHGFDLRTYIHITWKLGETEESPYTQRTLVLPLGHGKELLIDKRKITWFSSREKEAEIPLPDSINPGAIFNYGENVYHFPRSGKNNIVQIFTPNGKYYAELKGDILLQKSTSPRILGVNQATGQVFIINGDCLYLAEVTPGNVNTRLLLSGFNFKEQYICTAFYDQSKEILLLGSLVKGLFVLKKKNFYSKSQPGVSAFKNIVEDQIVYNDSSVLTDKGLVFNSGNNTSIPVSATGHYKEYAEIRLLRTDNHFTWIANGTILSLYNNTNLNKPIRKWQLAVPVSEMTKVSDQLWCGSPYGAIYSIDYLKEGSLPEKVVQLDGHTNSMTEDKDCVWITTTMGLFLVNKLDYKTTIIKEFKGEEIRGLYSLDKDELWICTYDKGLWLYRNSSFTRFPADRNGYLNTVHSVLQDEKGYLWLSTNNGIFQVRKKDLLNYASNPTIVPFYLYHGTESGFETGEFNGGNNRVGIRLPNGFFCLASMNGTVFFHPDSVRYLLPDNVVIIDNIEVANKSIKVSDSLLLERNFHQLSITIATPYLGNINNLLFDYKLDDNNWVSFSGNQININTLSSGNHILQIRKRAGFGYRYINNTIWLHVSPGWWETGIFRISALLTIIAFIWFIFRVRLYLLKKRNARLKYEIRLQTQKLQENITALEYSEKQLKSENQFQERLNRQIAHDIRTPLKYLAASSKRLHTKVREHKALTPEDSSGLYSSLEHVYLFVDKLVNFLSVRNTKNYVKGEIDIYQLVEQKFKIFALTAKEQGNFLINLVPKSLKIKNISEYFDVLVHNILDNALKNTNNGTIKVEAARENERWVITISDTGPGMPAKIINEYNDYFNKEKDNTENFIGFGFITIKNILPILNSTMFIKSGEGNGTSIILTIKNQG